MIIDSPDFSWMDLEDEGVVLQTFLRSSQKLTRYGWLHIEENLPEGQWVELCERSENCET